MATFSSIQKWRNYKFVMFIHYGMYSILGHGEWAMYSESIDCDEYAKLKDQFTADKFDAVYLADLAKKSRYEIHGTYCAASWRFLSLWQQAFH